MLEAHIRKLVREEASGAAGEALVKIGDRLASAVQTGTCEAVRSAAAAVDQHRRVHWSPITTVATTASATADVNDLGAAGLVAARQIALDVAVARSAPSDAPELIVARAAVFAAFLLDGTPSIHGAPR